MKKLAMASLILVLIFLPLLALGEGTLELSFTFGLDKTSVNVGNGESITATIDAAGGTAPYTYYVSWLVKEQETLYWADGGGDRQSSNTSTFTPKYGDSGFVSIYVYDSEGHSAWSQSEPFAITGSPVTAPLALSIMFNPETVDVSKGESITATLTAMGGTAPYKYLFNWYVTDDDTEQNKENTEMGSSDTDTFKPLLGQSGRLHAYIRDSLGRYLSVDKTFTIAGSPVVDPLALSISFNSETVDVSKGESIAATLTPAGGKAPYTYNYSWYVTDGSEEIYAGGSGDSASATHTFKPRYGQTGRLEARVTDSVGRYFTAEKTFTIAGSPVVDPLDLSISFASETVDVSKGESIAATLTPAGGKAPYTYNYTWYVTDGGDERYMSGTGDRTSATHTFKPLYGQTGRLRAVVMDSVGRYFSTEKTFTIAGSPVVDPLDLSISFSPETVDVSKGESIAATLTPAGGKAPYTYNYTWYVTDGGQERYISESGERTSATHTFKPLYGQTGCLRAVVRDSVGRYFSTEKTFTIAGSPAADPLTLGITLSKATVDVSLGERITATLTPAGGKGPYAYEYLWSVLDNGVFGANRYRGDTTAITDTYKPFYGQSGHLRASVTDTLGRKTSSEATFALTNSPVIEPMSLSAQLDKTSVAAGTFIKGSWQASGGMAPYRYDYSWYVVDESGENMLDGRWETSETQSLFLPLFGYLGYFDVTATDIAGNSISKNFTFEITGSPQAEYFTVDISLDKETVAANGEGITASWLVTGGKAPYTVSYDWYAGEQSDDETYQSGEYDTTKASDTFYPKFGSSGRISVNVSDSDGRNAYESESFGITGSPAADPLVLSLSLDRDTVALDKGESLTGTWSATGGTKPYVFTYSWYISPLGADWSEGVEAEENISKLTDSFRPFYGESGYLSVEVKDALGRRAYQDTYFEITGNVEAEPLIVSAQLDKTSLAVGETITAQWSAQGGKGPYTFSYDWSVWDASSSSYEYVKSGYDVVETTASFIPKFGLLGRLSISVTDSTGRNANNNIYFEITGAVKNEPLALTVTLDKAEVVIGQEIMASLSASGGTAPYKFVANWYIQEEGQDSYGSWIEGTGEIDALFDGFVPLFGKQGRVDVRVTDTEGRRQWADKTFTITGATALSPLALSLSLDKDTADASKGETITANWAASGGAGDYLYDVYWEISEYDTGSGAKTVRRLYDQQGLSDSLAVTYGTYGSVGVNARDKDGRSVSTSKVFDITGSQAAEIPLRAVITLDPEEKGKGGESMTASVAISGGTAPYTCAFEWYSGGRSATSNTEKFSSQPQGDSTRSSATLPNISGSGFVEATVRDAGGRVLIASEYFTITASNILRGDANKDGGIDIIDLVSIIDHIVSGTEPASKTNADANGDGTVDILDLVWVIDRIVG